MYPLSFLLALLQAQGYANHNNTAYPCLVRSNKPANTFHFMVNVRWKKVLGKEKSKN